MGVFWCYQTALIFPFILRMINCRYFCLCWNMLRYYILRYDIRYDMIWYGMMRCDINFKLPPNVNCVTSSNYWNLSAMLLLLLLFLLLLNLTSQNFFITLLLPFYYSFYYDLIFELHHLQFFIFFYCFRRSFGGCHLASCWRNKINIRYSSWLLEP